MLRACDNPFAVDRLQKVRYRPQGMTWEALMKRLAQMEYRGAIVGPEGVGKTTLLEDLEPRLEELGFRVRPLRLDAENASFERGFVDSFSATLGEKDVILFDGVEQLSRITWEWFLWKTRAAGGLIITVHSEGRLPTLIHCSTTAELLAEIGAEILSADPDELTPLARSLHEKHSGNVRESLLEWYDLVGESGVRR